jgi:GntP family gluconate:H+ symporter
MTGIESTHHDIYLLTAALVAIAALLGLIVFARLHAMLSLLSATVLLGLLTRMPLAQIPVSIAAGAGAVLGHVAIILGLGAMIGGVMAESGAALSICDLLLRVFGEKKILWAMLLLGLLVGLTAFFEAGFVLLVPIALVLARRTGLRPIYLGLPVLAGLSIAHGLVPPHPAVLLAVAQYHADIGRTMLFGLAIGIPAAALAGPAWAWLLYRNGRDGRVAGEQGSFEVIEQAALPNATLSLGLLLLPVALIALGTFGGRFLAEGRTAHVLRMVGSAEVALLLTLLLDLVLLAGSSWRRWNLYEAILTQSLAPTANILMLLATAGSFGRVLQDGGASAATVRLALHAHMPLLLLAWLIAVSVRLATGSATVATATTTGILAASAAAFPHPELLALATGAGSIFFSYVNDPGFWLVKEYFGLEMKETVLSWSLCETILSVSALGLVLVAAAWLR